MLAARGVAGLAAVVTEAGVLLGACAGWGAPDQAEAAAAHLSVLADELAAILGEMRRGMFAVVPSGS